MFFRKWFTKLINEEMVGKFEKERKALLDDSRTALLDIQYRIDSLRDLADRFGVGVPLNGKVHSTDLNLATHMIDGYTFTNASPVAGSVAWTNVNIVYKGTSYLLTDGNTAKKYLYWTLATTPTTLQSSDTKPTLTMDDILIGVNENGNFVLVMDKMTPGASITSGSVSGTEIGSKAVGSGNIGDLAVGNGQLANTAVTGGKIAATTITGSNLVNNTLTATQVANQTLTATQLANQTVTATQIANNTITATQIGAKAVGTGQLADASVTATQLGAKAVGTAALGDGAVTATQLGAGAVTAGKLGTGAVSEGNLNVATHFLF